MVRKMTYDGVKIRSANWHLTARCNYNCKFCFSQKLGTDEISNLESAEEVLKKLKRLGIEKMNFVGGEPLLHPLFFLITKMAKDLGFTVSVVSNGYYLNRDVVSKLSSNVDWIGLSIDSANEEVELALGRGNGNHVKHIIELVDIVYKAGIKLKINTTVTRLNWMEDMRPLVRALKPERWKVFQVLHIGGQNDLHFGELSTTDEQFNQFRLLNQEAIEGLTPVFEGNHEMIDSYFMLSPGGMAMSNREGTNRVLTPLVGIEKQNFSSIINVQKYAERGAIYSW